MYIDTNREPSSYQDDYYTETKSEYSRLKQEKHELSDTRFNMRKRGKWDWGLEVDYREQMVHLNNMIQSESGVY